MSTEGGRDLARRLELLELEAEVQRVALAATLEGFERLEQRRTLAWLAGAGYKAVKTIISTPRLRWLLLAAVLRRLGHRST